MRTIIVSLLLMWSCAAVTYSNVAELILKEGSTRTIIFESLFPTVPSGDSKIFQSPTLCTLESLDRGFQITVNNGVFSSGISLVHDSLVYSYERDVDGGFVQKYALLNITIVRPRPKAIDKTYQSQNRRPQVVRLTAKDSGKITTYTILSLSPDCSLADLDGNVISEVPKRMQAHQFLATPHDTFSGKCQFRYRVTNDETHLTSNVATITIVVTGVTSPPRAYPTRYIMRLGQEVHRSVELLGLPSVPRTNISFEIQSLPTVGWLFQVPDTSQGLSDDFKLVSAPVTVYTGPKTRVVLIYKLKNSSALQVGVDTFSFTVSGEQGLSSPAVFVSIRFMRSQPPVCGATTIDPVFWDRPLKNIRLNYSDPAGFSAQHLTLTRVPQQPAGDLIRIVFGRRKILQVGDYFTDEQRVSSTNRFRGSLQYRPRARLPDGESMHVDEFEYRVINFQRESCFGTLKIVMRNHDQEPMERHELVRLRSVSLLRFWGKANRSFSPVAIRIVSPPTFGRIYSVNANAPYDKGRMTRSFVEVDSYCLRHNCLEYFNPLEIVEKDSQIRQQTLTNGFDTLQDLFYFYVSPASATHALSAVDSFSIVFISASGVESELQKIVIHYKKQLSRVITVNYDVPVRWDRYDQQEQTTVLISIPAAADQQVLLMTPSMWRRHNRTLPFRLFDLIEHGSLILPGVPLIETTRNGVTGLWLENKNSAVLVPTVRSRQHRFYLRARIYNITVSGLPNPQGFEEVRVVVQRNNRAPFWNTTALSNPIFAEVGQAVTIMLEAVDPDDDLLTARIEKSSHLGALFYAEQRFGMFTKRSIRTGSVLRIPKGQLFRSLFVLEYLAPASPDLHYPVEDSFSLYAFDGSASSSLLLINITILDHAHLRYRSAVKAQTQLMSHTGVVVMVVATFIVLVIAVVAVIRRQKKLRYMQLPVEMEVRK